MMCDGNVYLIKNCSRARLLPAVINVSSLFKCTDKSTDDQLITFIIISSQIQQVNSLSNNSIISRLKLSISSRQALGLPSNLLPGKRRPRRTSGLDLMNLTIL